MLQLRYISIGFLMLAALCTQAQDIHFSQFWHTPMNLNPAQVGGFDGDWRLTANSRRQWASVTNPYRTFGGSFDAHQLFNAERLGAGLSIYNDKAGDSQFSTLEINLAGAYSIPLDGMDHTITLGLQSGITQRKIDITALTFDNQWNGSRFDGSLGSNETFATTSRVYPNLNTGLFWRRQTDKRTFYSAGFSGFNLLAPKQSFFGDDAITLDRRWSIHATTAHQLNDDLDLQPGLLFQTQGTYRELDIGTNLKYYLDKSPYHYRAVYVGAWTRMADAGYLYLGLDYDDLNIGVSYDINYSPLRTVSRWRGGLELSLSWIIRSKLPDRGRFKACPDFL